eukprot:7025217-Prymnesium_polylepis.1
MPAMLTTGANKPIITCCSLRSRYKFVQRLTIFEVLAGLLSAIVHDYKHPGTTNAHEIKMRSQARGLALSIKSSSPCGGDLFATQR